ncbi:hypothetical protein AGOR_G00069810 [Albula goreensis]|uniref:Threonylcarbamoyl-AMP synthase n=1 Tax=Albula goreensis TaxID=1534307 RepID=A0A8T3DME6_9TELE|nr:hypothetical protein AGOR_G00069810 [Albula goreensis]
MATSGFASVFYSEPAVLGLLANVFSAFYVALQNFAHVATGSPAHGLENTLAGVHLILIGGVVQLVAGLLTFRKYDHLAGTTFLAFAALWGSYGATRLVLGSSDSIITPAPTRLPGATALPNITTELDNSTMVKTLINVTVPTILPQPPPIDESATAGLIAYISVAFIVTFCSATANYIMPVVFGAITVTLILEAVGLKVTAALAASGAFQLVITLVGLYGASALLLKGLYQRHVLPGFGNALFDVLLLGAAIKPSVRKQVRKGGEEEEKKKDSKYAEPYALGNMTDTVAAAILAFHAFGYPTSFQVGALWVSFDAAAQLLASYYACLKGDAYHCTKFGLHLALWVILSWEQFVGTVSLPGLGVGLAEVAEARLSLTGNWFFVITSLLPCLLSLSRDRLELVHNLAFTLVTLATIPQIPTSSRGYFLGVALAIYSFLSLAISFISLVNSIAEKILIPRGNRLVSTLKLQEALFGFKRCLTPRLMPVPASPATPAQLSARLPDALFYLCNGLSAFAAMHLHPQSHARSLLALPGVLVPGTLLQVFVARLQVRGGRRFGPTVPFCYAAIWATWSWLRFADPFRGIPDPSLHAFTAAAVAFLTINFFIIIIAAYSNTVLLILTLAMEALLVSFLLFTINKLPLQMEVVFLALFSIVCLYGAIASLVNHVFEKNLMPMGPRLLKSKKMKPDSTDSSPPCPCPSSKKTTGLMTIAKILKEGGVCGIPSDTVYTLSASCEHPEAIQRIYNIKDRPMEKPICLTIATLEQLVAVNPPFSPLLWEFMRHVYPGGIGCIVKKGEWLRKLGVGEAYDYVGTKDSIMIRISDLTVTTHLLSMTGPLAITSANPSGEPDSTHHDMVISRLADKLDGILCDGDSTELVSSTVVICTKIDEGTLSFLREGAVPKAKVLQIFETVKAKMAAKENA